jgi:polygalacturonase
MPARKALLFPWLFVIAILSATAELKADSGQLLDATEMGVVGDGATVNTIAIQKAIDTCSAGGGGAIQFTAGHYVTGTIQLKDNVTLRLDEKAVLLGSTNAADYRNVDPFIAGDGIALGYALIVAQGADHAVVALHQGYGPGGSLDQPRRVDAEFFPNARRHR